MRIGIDMIGVQDPTGAGRGIGRYTEAFVDAFIRSDPGNEYLLYYFEPLGQIPPVAPVGARIQVVPSEKMNLAAAAQNLIDRNPDKLDVYLVTSPFSWGRYYLPPCSSAQGPRLAAILYDLIPMLLDRDFYLGRNPRSLGEYYEHIHRLKQYDHLLAISEASRRDALNHLGMPDSRVVNILSATREGFFAPAPSADLPTGLKALGIEKPFVLSVAGGDRRKNSDGLILAFARLPEAVRAKHQLAILCALSGNAAKSLTKLAKQHGVGDQLVLTGHVSDEQLREAYQHCAAMAFLSHYEGFGLPILEAMLCGAPVLAGDNSSQPEVVGDAGLLASTTDEADVADKLARLLTDPVLAGDLRRRAPEQAQRFTWQECARRAHSAMRGKRPARGPKPLLAFFSPLPPQHGAVAVYAQSLLEELRQHYRIHLYHDAGQVPHVALRDSNLAAFDYRLFEDHDRAWAYHAILYQMDNRDNHGYIYEMLLRHPGVVTLHDPRLVGFHAWYGDQMGDAQRHLEQEAAFSRPDLPAREHQRIARCAIREASGESHPEIVDLDLTRRIFASSLQVILGDEVVAERHRAALPDHRDCIHAIPFGTETAIGRVAVQYVAVIEQAAASRGRPARQSA